MDTPIKSSGKSETLLSLHDKTIWTKNNSERPLLAFTISFHVGGLDRRSSHWYESFQSTYFCQLSWALLFLQTLKASLVVCHRARKFLSYHGMRRFTRYLAFSFVAESNTKLTKTSLLKFPEFIRDHIRNPLSYEFRKEKLVNT